MDIDSLADLIEYFDTQKCGPDKPAIINLNGCQMTPHFEKVVKILRRIYGAADIQNAARKDA